MSRSLAVTLLAALSFGCAGSTQDVEHALEDVRLGIDAHAAQKGPSFSCKGEKLVLTLRDNSSTFELRVDARSSAVSLARADAKASVSLRPLAGPVSVSEGVARGRALVFAGAHAAVVLTPHARGIKEDIVLTRDFGDSLSFEWELALTDGLEARLERGGEVRIRETSGRPLYAIPAPVIRHAGSPALRAPAREEGSLSATVAARQAEVAPPAATARFELHGNRLRLTAQGLSSLTYPISIDPSLVLTSAADFGLAGNDEGGVDITASDLLRAKTTIGAGTWSATTSFTTLRERHTSVAYNGFVYVIGGSNPGYLNDIQYAALNSNGTTGAFATTTAFPTARAGHSSVAYNGYLYILGGTNGGLLNDVQVAPLNANGTVGAFTATTPFATARSGHTSFAYNGYLYVLGGFDGTNRRSDVQVAKINANGTLGAWSTTTALGTARELHASVVQNDFVYVLGGYTGAARLNDVQRAKLNPDGTVGAWIASGTFTTARQGHTAVLHAGYLYLMGGFSGAARLNDVQVALVQAGGGLGNWADTGTFTTARDGHAGFGYKGYLFLLGGFDGTARLADVRSAPLNSAGQVPSSWSTTTALPTAAYQSSSVAYNGFIYNIGGSGSLAASRYAPINADGTLGAWVNATPLGVNRFAHWVVAYNNFIYVLGGNDTTFRNTVYFAPINADGSLGTWATTTPFTTARREHKGLVHNGYLYVLGGENASGALNSVEYAAINPNGTVGAWSTTTSFTTPRSCFTSVTHNNFMYVIGGFTGPDCSGGNAATANTQFAPINANGSVGAWTNTTPMPLARESMGAVVHNGRLFIAGGYDTNPVALANVVPFNANGTLGTWQTLTSLPGARDWTHMVSQNGFLYLIGGYTNSANATIFTVKIDDGETGTVGAFTGTTALATARSGHASVGYQGHVYVLGGNGGSFLNDVQESTVSPNGTLGTWNATSSFATGRSGHTAVACNGFLYVLGGFDGTTRRNDVQFATVNANGSIGAWTATTAFATGRSGHASACEGGFLYVAGGFDGTTRRNDVQYAPVNANGTLGAWTTTTALPSGRERHAAVVQDGYLFVVGGFDGTNRLNDVFVAPLNANGTLGAWSEEMGITVARENPAAVAYGGHLYVMGGSNGGYLSSVEVAPFLSNGGLGNWFFSSPFATARDGQSTVALNGFAYVIGGTNGTLRNDVQVAPLRTPTRKGTYSKLIDFGAVVTVDTLSLGGNAARQGTVRLEYRVAPASGVLGASVDRGVAPLGTALTLNESNSRYLWVRLELDDELSSVVNADGTSERDISDLTVVYTPVPVPTQLGFVAAVASASAGANLFPAVQVAIRDSGGATVTTSTATVTLALGANPGGSTLGGTLSAPAVNGIATFSDLSLDRVGTGYSLVATSTGLTDATSSGFNITPGAPSRIVVTGVSTPRLVAQTSNLTLDVQDAQGNRVTGYTGTVVLSSSDNTATLPAAYTFGAGDSGLHTFTSAVAFNQPGTFSLTAADSVSSAMAGTLGGILVRQAQGGTCTTASECGTGICANGVCCATACTGACMACNNAGSVGTCSPRPNGSSCPDSTYCNGVEVCQAGVCTAGTAVVCEDPEEHDVLFCDEPARRCSIVPMSPPGISHDAVLVAGVGNPYVYNAQGAITASGERPMTFSACAGPPEFHVEPGSGAVSWTPSAVGNVALCVAAKNSYGTAQYPFTVTVSAPTGALPTASFTATPPEGTAPLAVRFDASASRADAATTLALYRWDFGRSGPLGSGVAPSVLFHVPGSSFVTLTVVDGFGRTASARQPMVVLAPNGGRPPTARIVASALAGTESLTSTFSCDCTPGSAPLRGQFWDFPDGTGQGATVSHTFSPGRHRVRLTVVDEAGLTATDTVEVVVTQAGREPPTCRAWAFPSEGAAPLEVRLRATYAQPQGSIASVTWTLWDGTQSTGPDVRRELARGGQYLATLRVVDDAGQSCNDQVLVSVGEGAMGLLPPRILSVPSAEASCGEQSRFGEGQLPLVSGMGPLTFSVEPLPGASLPAGLGVDADTGQLRWTPTRDAMGGNAFLLRVTTPSGTDARAVSVDVGCAPRMLVVGCSCQAFSGMEAVAGLLLLPLLFARRRDERYRFRKRS